MQIYNMGVYISSSSTCPQCPRRVNLLLPPLRLPISLSHPTKTHMPFTLSSIFFCNQTFVLTSTICSVVVRLGTWGLTLKILICSYDGGPNGVVSRVDDKRYCLDYATVLSSETHVPVWFEIHLSCDSHSASATESSHQFPYAHTLEGYDLDGCFCFSSCADFDRITKREAETHLQEMQIELENLAWNRKQLDERLQIAMKERSIMASVLDELEEEHEKAISKIELLEIELQDLKDENLYLKETNEKGKWDSKSKDDHYSYGDEIHEYDVPLLKSGYKGSGIIIKDHLTHKDAWEDENKGKIQPQDLLKLETKGSGLRYSLSETITPDSLRVAEAHDRCRDVALSQSLFSATLSLLVGVIIWTAEDPCMPLVVALFTVVGMSLKSVVQFFSSLKNRPASEAVALLSFNWFILGTLTYPTLPSVADIMIPRTLRLADRIIVWLGLSSLLQME